MKTALLLMAHGSSNDDANSDLRALVSDLRRRDNDFMVEASFLELARPTIEEAAHRCVAQGAERVIMIPYFLSAGVHVRRDLTEIRNRLAECFTQIDFRLAAPLGRHPLLLEVLLQRAREAAGKNDLMPPHSC
jgi:sirohydrochlorin ferrochelatase